MNEKQISRLCVIVVTIGIIIFLLSPNNVFSEKTVNTIKLDEKGILFGKIDYIIKNSPSTIFVFNDGNQILAYYPKETLLQTNDFITIYAQKQLYNGEEELFIYKVIKE